VSGRKEDFAHVSRKVIRLNPARYARPAERDALVARWRRLERPRQGGTATGPIWALHRRAYASSLPSGSDSRLRGPERQIEACRHRTPTGLACEVRSDHMMRFARFPCEPRAAANRDCQARSRSDHPVALAPCHVSPSLTSVPRSSAGTVVSPSRDLSETRRQIMQPTLMRLRFHQALLSPPHSPACRRGQTSYPRLRLRRRAG
jgi:hypothetical protein